MAKGEAGGDNPKLFGTLLLLTQIVFIVVYGLFVDYQTAVGGGLEEGEHEEAYDPNHPDKHGENLHAGGEADKDRVMWYYPMFQDVHVMIFIGFGFLMTFLKKYAWSSLSYTMLVSCLCIQWSIICLGVTHAWWTNHAIGTATENHLHIQVEDLIKGDFAAGAVLISFGALLGRITPSQLLVMAFLEIIFYSINELFGVEQFSAVDMGGSMFVHTFGAYFGLACSFTLGAPKNENANKHNNGAEYQSDLNAMIGTIFLWMFWPSFNGALAPNEYFEKERVVINTVLALCASCMTTFAMSRLMDPSSKFNMVHIQNATLAGGVAVGSSSDLVIGPFGSMLVGTIAGMVSVLGYVYLTPFLEKKGLRDTCGINNLHGMPGIIGGIGGIISASTADVSSYGSHIGEIFPARADGARSAGEQGKYQAMALIVTLVISLVSGALVGLVLRSPLFTKEANSYSDENHWVLDSDEETEAGGHGEETVPLNPKSKHALGV